MIKFNSKKMGEVKINFYHTLPSIKIPECHNDLVGMIRNMKIQKGETECKLLIGDQSYYGMAYTHPSDQYKKEVGRKLSLARAIQAASLNSQEEREVLAGYFSR